MRWCACLRASKPTGTRRKCTSAGALASQASSSGSNAKQCGHAYQKNSMTSILPPGGTATGLASVWKSRPSTGAPPCARARPGRPAPASASAPATPATFREKRRRSIASGRLAQLRDQRVGRHQAFLLAALRRRGGEAAVDADHRHAVHAVVVAQALGLRQPRAHAEAFPGALDLGDVQAVLLGEGQHVVLAVDRLALDVE